MTGGGPPRGHGREGATFDGAPGGDDSDFGDPASTGPDGGLPRLAGASGRDVGAARPGGGRVPGGLGVQAGGASLRLPDPLDRGGGHQRRGGRDGDGPALAG